ncbi:helix-turn-helix transcriptional regulator [Mammaliicoccus sciuri]|uniref:helix-turn-helix transcriptional regulator n=1 Tax=Mammaliicoccus sciuri TaxID=1296 RepID=UPI0034DD91D9
MKKSERLNQELIFLSDRISFNLFELMSEFNISKRTALRDIKELEYLGMPIYSESGKNGGYKLTNQSLLSPIYFTQKEVYAIFFAFQLLNLIHTTPFEHSYRTIYKKFLATFSEERKIDIIKTSSAIRYVACPLLNIPKNLKKLYEIILEKKTGSVAK